MGIEKVLQSILESLHHGKKLKLPHQQVWGTGTCQGDTCEGQGWGTEQNWPDSVCCSMTCKELADPGAHCSEKEVTGGMNFQVHQ